MREERGQTLIEDILTGSLIVAGTMAVLLLVAPAMRPVLEQVITCLGAVTSSGASC